MGAQKKGETMMKLLVIISMFLILGGFTTVNPVELTPEQLHGKISTGDVVKVGQSVKIVASDGTHHKFKVTEITDTHVFGKYVDMPIKDIVALETQEFIGGKTNLLVE
jgi:hypothetical protein